MAHIDGSYGWLITVRVIIIVVWFNLPQTREIRGELQFVRARKWTQNAVGVREAQRGKQHVERTDVEFGQKFAMWSANLWNIKMPVISIS